MKLLIASCFYDLPNQIERQLHKVGLSVETTLARTADDVLQAISQDRYDCLLTEYALSDIDIWKLSSLIHSSRFCSYPIQLFLIQETCETEIPALLSNEYRFNVITLGQVAETVQAEPDPDDFKPKLLIIEDEESAADIALHALQDCYSIELASDGLIGIEKWLQHRHDIILLDLMLPKLSGDQVLSKILAIDGDQPIIIVTAFSDCENHKNLLINGASEFLGKPYSPAALRKTCRIVHNRAKLASEILYREDKFHLLGNQLWLLNQHQQKNDRPNSHLAMQQMQDILPFHHIPSDDEQIRLLKSVSSR